MSKVFKLEMAVYLTLDWDLSEDETPLDQKDKTAIEKRVISLLRREYPEVDAEVLVVQTVDE